MTARYLVMDVFDGLATLEDGSVDLVVTSPPFLALRSYLPVDHELKGKEIGSEATPAEFLDVMLRFTAELRRVVAPHGSIAIELGDTYAGSAPAGNMIVGEDQLVHRPDHEQAMARRFKGYGQDKLGPGWPLAKSKTLIPELYRIALAYGINPLTGLESPAGQWRIRNVVTWARPNPPVGALGDKWRPATSDVVVACLSGKRYWDDLATRRPFSEKTNQSDSPQRERAEFPNQRHRIGPQVNTHSGAPLLDYWEIPLLEGDEETRYGPAEPKPYDRPNLKGKGSRVEVPPGQSKNMSDHTTSEHGAPLLDYWVIPPGGYTGSHYAVFPPELVVPLVKAMCPERVCRTCGEPSRRIVETDRVINGTNMIGESVDGPNRVGLRQRPAGWGSDGKGTTHTEVGWTDCGHDDWRPGLVLDPFAGSGTALLVATGHGHDAIGIDLDRRNADLALERVGPFLLEVQ